MPSIQRITPSLWFDGNAEEAVNFYVSVFDNSRILNVTRYRDAGCEDHGMPAGSVLAMAFELDGQSFTALNGGPAVAFNMAVSFQVNCDRQQEIDRYWQALSEGTGAEAQRCGWLKDRFGLSWQIVPTLLPALLQDDDAEKSNRVMEAMLQMDKLDIAALQSAYRG